MNINSNVRSAANAIKTIGFNEFILNISRFPKGTEVTVANVLGNTLWESMDAGARKSLGKAIRGNINCGNLLGLTPVPTRTGQNQIYQVTDKVSMLTIFSSHDWGSAESIESVLNANSHLKNYAFIKCYHEVVAKNGVQFKVETEAITSCGKLLYRPNPLEIKRTYLDNKGIDYWNIEIRSILALWYGFDKVFENRAELKSNGVSGICFLAANHQMMERVGVKRFDSANSAYSYTALIQEIFAQFKPGELKELPFTHGIISLRNEDIRGY